jgi:hypothetical protein
MPARSFAALGATVIVVACSTEAPTTASKLPVAIGSSLTEKTPAPATSGVLKMCLVSGAGLTAGQTFTSAITLAGVTRSLANTTGTCAQLEVPRESTPQGKGLLQSKPTEVTRLLPGTATLVVARADLASSDVLAILGAAPNVQASSALLLNLAQQLIATELNVLRGVQASLQVNQAIADANAALEISLGSQITIGPSLASSQVSALVSTLTAFNEGKTKPPPSPPSVDVDIVQTAVNNVEVQSIGCVPSTSCSGGSLVLGRITTTVTSGNETQVTYTNQSQPILRVCIESGIGVPKGTALHFEARQTGLAPLDFDVPAGDCREAQTQENAAYDLVGTRVAGIAIPSIACDPSTQCSLINVPEVSVRPFIPRGVTTVTFSIRTSLGKLRLCKLAGIGIEPGTEFVISAENHRIKPLPGELADVTASVAANGGCVENTLLEGSLYRVAEGGAFTGMALESVTCEPAQRCGPADEDEHFVHADIVAGSTTSITFTNRTALGSIRVCVGQSAGVPFGTLFMIDVSPISVVAKPGEPTAATPTVPTGDCREATLKEGIYRVSEFLPPDFFLGSIVCDPAARCTPDLGANVRAAIVAGSTTVVTFTNEFSTSRVAPRGDLRVRSP